MTTTLSFKDFIDLPVWRPLASPVNAHAAGGAVVSDLRRDVSGTVRRGVRAWQLVSLTVLNDYNMLNDGWSFNISPGLTGTFGVGATAVFKPAMGPRGSIAAGSTTSVIKLTTALPGTVGVGQLANKGSGVGYAIRIIGNRAGGSGLVQERIIVNNTGATTTPDIYLDSPLTFTPDAGDTYEILSGRVYMLSAGTLAAGCWKAYDVATGVVLANLATTNLPATINTDSAAVALDEQYCCNACGEGFILGAGDGGINGKALTATASTIGTLTGQTVSGDFGLAANEYRNFQIRIVKDTAIPTAVGQRRKIASHTGGAIAPVYTLATNWTVTPSPTCQYVIEHANEILLWSSGSANTHTYAEIAIGSMTANSWDTTTYSASGSVCAAGVMAFTPFATPIDTQKLNRYSNVWRFRGGSINLDLLDIAGGATGLWSNAVAYGGGIIHGAGSCGTYEPHSGDFYINVLATNVIMRFDPIHRYCENYAQLRWAQGTAAVGHRMFTNAFVDGTVAVPFVHILGATQANHFQSLISR